MIRIIGLSNAGLQNLAVYKKSGSFIESFRFFISGHVRGGQVKKRERKKKSVYTSKDLYPLSE